MSYMRLMWAGVFAVTLAGCAADGMDEVREFVKTAHADKKPKVEPLPEIKTQEAFIYAAASLSDPFGQFNLRSQGGKGSASTGGPRPDPTRRKEPLEEYPLDALRMSGTLSRARQNWAVIVAPDGTVHRVKVGDHMGQNFGLITKIIEDKINLIELVQGSSGDWVERESSITLAE